MKKNQLIIFLFMNIVLNIPAWAQNEIKLDCPSENEGIIGTTFCNKFYTHTIPATWPKEPGPWAFRTVKNKWKAKVQKLTDECCAQLAESLKKDQQSDQCSDKKGLTIFADNDPYTSYECAKHWSGAKCSTQSHKVNENDVETKTISECLPKSYPQGGQQVQCQKQETIFTTQLWNISCSRDHSAVPGRGPHLE
jgi:hypothetical protein